MGAFAPFFATENAAHKTNKYEFQMFTSLPHRSHAQNGSPYPHPFRFRGFVGLRVSNAEKEASWGSDLRTWLRSAGIWLPCGGAESEE